MNLNTPSIKSGPLVAHDFDIEPWVLPRWEEQTAAERGYHEAAHAATELCDDDGLPPHLSYAERALLVLIGTVSVSLIAAVALHVWRAFA